VRVGLCSWDDRQKQLACAHTTARHQLIDAVEALARQGLIREQDAQAIAQLVTELANVIHSTDWSKGELEAEWAIAIESGDMPAAGALQAQIERLASDHTAASRQLHILLERLRRVAGWAPSAHRPFD
jgi:hypothetical protein